MRTATRRRHVEDEEESAFVSMTDMTVSFLFIVMILLAFFASQIRNEDTVPRLDFDRAVTERDEARQALAQRKAELTAARARIAELEWTEAQQAQKIERLGEQVGALTLQVADLTEQVAALKRRLRELEEQLRQFQRADPLEVYLNQVAAERRTILEQLRDNLKSDIPGLQVELSSRMDALRFKGDGLFSTSSSNLAPEKQRIVQKIAERLETILPCYTLGPGSAWTRNCNGVDALIEAVQIEGHTDATGDDNPNLSLSTERANATFFAMTGHVPDLTAHRNSLDQPVLSVAGYGEMRPVADNSTAEGRATNRRIDLRIIMYTPQNEADIARVKEDLRRGVVGDGSP